MSHQTPRRLLDLACQSLLRDEKLVIAAVEWLPMQLFPSLFRAALAGRHSNVLKALVQAWPFPCLPLGTLINHRQHYQEIFQAVLDGLDALLSQDTRPRRCKMQMLNLRRGAHQEFWIMSARSRVDVCSVLEPKSSKPMRKSRKMESLRAGPKPLLAPVEVLVDLCLKRGVLDEYLRYVIKKVRERRGLLHLCCKKLKVYTVSKRNMNILGMVQLNSVQDFKLNCIWKLSSLRKFAPLLGQMCNLRRFFLSQVFTSSHTSLQQEEQCVNLFTSQFLGLSQLQEIYLDEVSILKGRLDQILRCLKLPLKTLSITNCMLLESDLRHLSQHLNVSQLKVLNLRRLNLTNISSGILRLLLERASPNLQKLDLDECGIMDPQFMDLLPALSHCSQLISLSFCENTISMTVLEDLLHHTIGLSKLNCVLYPAPLESYEDRSNIINMGRLAQVHGTLKHMLEKLGRPGMFWFCNYPCPHCDYRIFYKPNPIL